MRVCHDVTAVFDDPNLVSCAGLTPVVRLAERARLGQLVAAHVKIDKPGGGNAQLKVPCLGYAKQGAGRGYTGVKGLNALLAIVSTPSSAPVSAAARLRKGSTNSARGADRFVADALITAKKAGASGVLVLRADSAYYGHDVIAAALRQRACFSITARQDKAVRKAIASIDNDAWTSIKYTNAVFDEDQQRWISDAQVAEIAYTAFTSRPKAKHVRARLIVRRGHRHEPQQSERAVHRIPLPRSVYEQPAGDARSGEGAPGARDCRAGHRRPEERATGAPALRAFLGQQRLAGLRHDRVQPHPRRRRAGLDLPRPGDDRHDPRAARHRPGTPGPLRPTAHPAPADQLALADSVGATGDHSEQPTTRGLTHPPVRQDLPEHHRGDQPAHPPGHLDAPTPRRQEAHAPSMITEGATVDPGLGANERKGANTFETCPNG